jgi:hypothetical protein
MSWDIMRFPISLKQHSISEICLRIVGKVVAQVHTAPDEVFTWQVFYTNSLILTFLKFLFHNFAFNFLNLRLQNVRFVNL